MFVQLIDAYAELLHEQQEVVNPTSDEASFIFTSMCLVIYHSIICNMNVELHSPLLICTVNVKLHSPLIICPMCTENDTRVPSSQKE